MLSRKPGIQLRSEHKRLRCFNCLLHVGYLLKHS